MTGAKDAQGPRRRQRRKAARPGEIVAAALEVFAENGFGAATLETVARRAGVAKGTVFVYFPTKQDLFRAVAKSVVSANFDHVAEAAADRPLGEFVPVLLEQAARLGESRVSAMIRLLVAEARSFPDIAQVWHDEVAARMLGLLTGAIERAQAAGVVRAGDARLYAFSIIGPMLAGVIFREVFRETGAELPDLDRLARQHAATILRGLEATPAAG
jgi:AcrR family transcriptional regulator